MEYKYCRKSFREDEKVDIPRLAKDIQFTVHEHGYFKKLIEVEYLAPVGYCDE